MIATQRSGTTPDRPLSATLERRQGAASAAPSSPGVRPIAFGVLLAILGLVAAHVCFPQFYQTNDDPGMDLAVRGFGGGHPEPHLLFINILIGQLLAALCRQDPAFPWYRVLMLAVQAISAAVVYGVLLARGASRSKLLLAGLYLVVFDLYFYTNPQFTITAALAAQAAVMLWLESADRGRPLGPARLALFLGLLALSVMIRESSCFLILLLALPALAVTGVRLVFQPAVPAAPVRRVLAVFAVPFALGSGLIAGLIFYNDDQYRSQPQWREVARYNQLKSLIIDNNYIRYTPQTKWIFDHVGWSENDYEMFKTFAYFGDEIYGIDRLERLVGLYRAAYPQRSFATTARSDRAWSYRDVFGSTRPGAGARTALLFLPLLFLSWRRDRLMLVMLSMASVLLVISFLIYWVNRCPPRVSEPILAYFAGLAIFAADGAPTSRRLLLTVRALGALALLGLTVLYLWNQNASWNDACLARADFDQELARLQPARDRLFVNWQGALPLQLLDPLGSWENLRYLQILSVGTGTRTPPTKQLMHRFRVRDFFRDVYTRSDIIVLARPRVIDCLIRYADEHYHEKVVVRSMHPVYSRAVDGVPSLFCVFTLGRDQSD